jgi:hypothetical protein
MRRTAACSAHTRVNALRSFPRSIEQRFRGASLAAARPGSIMVEAMPATVKLKDIVDALDAQSDESTYFVDLDTGEVELVSKDLLREAEESGDDDDEGPDRPAWQEPEWELAKRIISTGCFKHLPSKFDVHEWSIMQDFALSMESGEIREALLNAIHGGGAFRHFKYALRVHHIESAWFEFRTDALRRVAIDWCKTNHILSE